MGCHFTASKKFMTWQAKIREQRPKNHGVIFICFCRERIQAEILEGCTTKKASNWKIIAVVWQAHLLCWKWFLYYYTYTQEKTFGKKRDNHKLFLEIYKVRATAAYFQAKSKNDLVHGQEWPSYLEKAVRATSFLWVSHIPALPPHRKGRNIFP